VEIIARSMELLGGGLPISDFGPGSLSLDALMKPASRNASDGAPSPHPESRSLEEPTTRPDAATVNQSERVSVSDQTPGRPHVQVDGTLARIRSEYLEMPDLRLTPAQVARLCGVAGLPCQVALDRLVQSRFLRIRSDGTYVRFRGAQ
jgi:hypothetical protein